MSVVQTLFAGNTWQEVPGTGAAATGALSTAAVTSPSATATEIPLMQVLSARRPGEVERRSPGDGERRVGSPNETSLRLSAHRPERRPERRQASPPPRP